MTVVIGDDQTYFNTFDVQNPKVFFGFSSLATFIEYVEAIPEYMQKRTVGYGTSQGQINFSGTNSMADALGLAKNGWREGFERSQEISEMLNVSHALQKKYVNSISGGFVNVAKMLSGNPVHMRKKAPMPGKKNITVFVNILNSAKVDAKNMIMRACVIGALVDLTERAGYSCELVAVKSCIADDERPDLIEYQSAITLKHFGEKLNVNDLIFAFGHPSFLRRMIFAAVGTRNELQDIWHTQGRAMKVFKDCNDVYIPHLESKQSQYVSSLKNDSAQIAAMFGYVAVNHSKRLGSQLLTAPGNGT